MDTAAPISTLPCGSCKDLLFKAFLGKTNKDPMVSVFAVQRRTREEWRLSIELGCPFCWWIFRNHMPLLTDSSQCHSALTMQSRWGGFGWGDVKPPREVTDGRRHMAEFFLMAEEGNPAAKYVRRRPPLATGSDEDFEYARSMITRCVREHGTCRNSKPTALPSRILEISALGNLILCEGLRETCQYAAVSYCWGESAFLQTTNNNLRRHCEQGIPVSELPLTLQDAVRVTKAIGLRHVWVDCLCIVQDDDEEKAREIQNMRHIFSNAWVTISAASASAVNDGFLGPRMPLSGEGLPSIALPWSTPDGETGAVQLYHRLDVDPNDGRFIFDDPIHKRAWTFQEHMLATRLLIYSNQQLIFVCRQHSPYSQVSESKRGNHSAVSRVIKPLAKGDKDKEGRWYSLLGEYSARHITVQSDRLPAVAGIASYFGAGEDYRAGLWKETLVSDLLWLVKEPRESRRVHRWIAPSWSWAALEGHAVHLKLHESGLGFSIVPEWRCHEEVHASVVECSATPVHESAPFGEIRDARLSLRGHLTTMQLDLNSMFMYVDNQRTKERIKVAVALPDTLTDFGSLGEMAPPDQTGLMSISCLALIAFEKPKPGGSIMAGLLLKKVSPGPKQEYSRIGIFRSLENMSCYFWAFKLSEFSTPPQYEHLIYDTDSPHDYSPSAAQAGKIEVVHESIACAGATCKASRGETPWIRGVRYWCVECKQDYCESCRNSPIDHPGPRGLKFEKEFHRFAVFTRPVHCDFMSNDEWRKSVAETRSADPRQVVDLI